MEAIVKTYDEFEDSYSFTTSRNNIENNPNWYLELFGFLMNGNLSHKLRIIHVNNTPSYLRSEIKFLIDGKRVEYTNDEPPYSSYEDDFSFESASFDITKEQLEEILNGKDIKLRIYCDISADFKLTEITLDDMRQYYEKIVLTNGDYNP